MRESVRHLRDGAFYAVCIFVGLMFAGCAELEKNMMTQTAQKIGDSVAAGIKKGLENGVSDVQMQAGVQGINPGYEGSVRVVVGTVVDVNVALRLTGVAGEMSASAASGRDAPAALDARAEPDVTTETAAPAP